MFPIKVTIYLLKSDDECDEILNDLKSIITNKAEQLLVASDSCVLKFPKCRLVISQQNTYNIRFRADFTARPSVYALFYINLKDFIAVRPTLLLDWVNTKGGRAEQINWLIGEAS